MQGKQLFRAAAIGLITFTMATPALAVMSVPNGLYLEVNFGSSHLSDKNYPPLASESSSGIGGNGNLGYKFMPYFAAEVGYTQYANTSVKAPDTTTAGNDKRYSYDFAFKGILPAYDTGLEGFAKLGIQHLNSHYNTSNENATNTVGLGPNSHNDVNAYYGGGAQYYFFPELAAVIQWQRANGNSQTGTMDLFSAGLSFIMD